MKKTFLIATISLATALVGFSQSMPSAPAVVPVTPEQMNSEADKFKKEGLPSAETATNAAPAASVANPKVQMVMAMLTSKLNLKPAQVDKVKGLVSKIDMTNLTNPKAQAAALVSSYTPDLTKILAGNQMSKLKALAALKK